MADLFISHSNVDTEWARELRRQLDAAGYTCWMAPDDVNGPLPWAEQILTAIQACRVMIIVVSHAANGSNHVSKEVGVALEHNKPLLPIRTEDIIPTGSLNYLLQLVQWIDAFPGSIADHLDRIRRAVAYSIPPVPATAAPPAAAGIVPGASVTMADQTQPAWPPPPPVAAPAPPPYTPPPAFQPAPPPPTSVTRRPGAALVVGTRVIGASTLIAVVAVAAFAVLALAAVGGVFSGRSGPTAQPTGGLVSVPPTTTAIHTPSPAPTAPPAATPSPTSSPAPAPTAPATPAPTPEPTGSPTPTSITNLALLLPSEVDGISLTARNLTGDDVFGTDAGSNSMRAFLASVGKTPGDLLLAEATDSGSNSDLEIYAFFVDGIDAILLQHAVITTGFATDADATITGLSLGGKSVVEVKSETSPVPVYFYTSHGVVFAVQTSDPHLADQAIATTPTV